MYSDEHADSDRSSEALEARLRALPQPPIPANLEARLLAAVPGAMPISARHWSVRTAALAVAAAACVVIALAWLLQHGKNARTVPVRGDLAQPNVHRPASEPPNIVVWRHDHQMPDEEKLPVYKWPLDETVSLRASISIPADLLD